ncbi:glycosyltransferase family 2 protein [Telmatocola sphagniphila]|uniref:Glycosyltransferase family 2 protein n=1 Tax=Telmatocola sphagniphila TaxID=1123043 RepID=A0A8E6B4Z0_9BACT|nr:glycosyltransferase family 2 protein [Telmatocola sphagniphila]QVL31191.1 glycosyltransferase family 2 protein [Telmatocola sphagniphila]
MRTCRIIIVNYRTKELVADCLQSLEAEMRQEPGCHVIIADNASPDDSVGYLKNIIAQHNWTWASVLPLPKNGGFSYGNNAGIRPLFETDNDIRYIHLLNPDTIVRPGAISRLLDFLEEHSEVGIAGSFLEEIDGTPQCAAFNFHSVLSEFERGLRFGLVTKILHRQMVAPPPGGPTRRVNWVSGASMMIRREVFEDIGLFDEDYFLYYEETDFELRARRAGWPIWHVAESKVVHLEGASTGVTGAGRALKRVPSYWFESRRRYFRKHHGSGYEFMANLAYASAYGAWRIRRKLQGKPDPDPPRLWQDFVRFNFGLGR